MLDSAGFEESSLELSALDESSLLLSARAEDSSLDDSGEGAFELSSREEADELSGREELSSWEDSKELSKREVSELSAGTASEEFSCMEVSSKVENSEIVESVLRLSSEVLCLHDLQPIQERIITAIITIKKLIISLLFFMLILLRFGLTG